MGPGGRVLGVVTAPDAVTASESSRACCTVAVKHADSSLPPEGSLPRAIGRGSHICTMLVLFKGFRAINA